MSDRKPMVALTFDDGPSEYTPGILDAFKRLGCHATFCEVGANCVRWPEHLQRTAAEGHDLVNHSWDHPQLVGMPPEEARKQLNDTTDAITRLTGYPVTGMRPPYGGHDQAVDELCRELGLYVLTWTFSTDDWDHNDADKTFASVKANVRDGAIILCHDRSSTARAVSMMVPWLRAQGYEVGSVRELLESRGLTARPGMLLTHAEDAR